MPVQLDAFKKYIVHREIADPKTHYQRMATIEVGRRAQMVVEHPGWQTYVDHLEAIKESVQVRRNRLAKDMADTDTLGEALTQMKLQLKSLDGELKGLSTAIDLIPEMIKRAQDLVTVFDKTGDKSTAAE